MRHLILKARFIVSGRKKTCKRIAHKAFRRFTKANTHNGE